jgi:hypothetical protein
MHPCPVERSRDRARSSDTESHQPAPQDGSARGAVLGSTDHAGHAETRSSSRTGGAGSTTTAPGDRSGRLSAEDHRPFSALRGEPSANSGADTEPPELLDGQRGHQRLRVRAPTIQGCKPSLSQAKRKLLRFKSQSNVRREEQPWQQRRVDVETRRREPRLCEDVMQKERARAVRVAAEQTVPVDEPKSRERRVRREAMLEGRDLVRLKMRAKDGVDHILIAEVEGVR